MFQTLMGTSRRMPASCILLSVTLSLAMPLMAQFNVASLGGTVTDHSGGAIPDAKVTTRNTGTGSSRTVLTG